MSISGLLTTGFATSLVALPLLMTCIVYLIYLISSKNNALSNDADLSASSPLVKSRSGPYLLKFEVCALMIFLLPCLNYSLLKINFLSSHSSNDYCSLSLFFEYFGYEIGKSMILILLIYRLYSSFDNTMYDMSKRYMTSMVFVYLPFLLCMYFVLFVCKLVSPTQNDLYKLFPINNGNTNPNGEEFIYCGFTDAIGNENSYSLIFLLSRFVSIFRECGFASVCYQFLWRLYQMNRKSAQLMTGKPGAHGDCGVDNACDVYMCNASIDKMMDPELLQHIKKHMKKNSSVGSQRLPSVSSMGYNNNRDSLNLANCEIMEDIIEEDGDVNMDMYALRRQHTRTTSAMNERFVGFEEKLNMIFHKMSAIEMSSNLRFDLLMNEVNVMKQSIDNKLCTDIENNKDQIQFWLQYKCKLPCYADLFIENGCDSLSIASLLTVEDLTKMGIDKVGHQMQILYQVQLLNQAININNPFNLNDDGGGGGMNDLDRLVNSNDLMYNMQTKRATVVKFCVLIAVMFVSSMINQILMTFFAIETLSFYVCFDIIVQCVCSMLILWITQPLWESMVHVFYLVCFCERCCPVLMSDIKDPMTIPFTPRSRYDTNMCSVTASQFAEGIHMSGKGRPKGHGRGHSKGQSLVQIEMKDINDIAIAK